MPMQFAPEIRLKAGTHNKDMKPPRTKDSRVKMGLNDAPIGELTKDMGKSGSGMNVSKNYITDTDMELLKNYGKSGKY